MLLAARAAERKARAKQKRREKVKAGWQQGYYLS
jgi:hypothetical protein